VEVFIKRIFKVMVLVMEYDGDKVDELFVELITSDDYLPPWKYAMTQMNLMHENMRKYSTDDASAAFYYKEIR
jgi:hypothetical protein